MQLLKPCAREEICAEQSLRQFDCIIAKSLGRGDGLGVAHSLLTFFSEAPSITVSCLEAHVARGSWDRPVATT